MRLHPSSAEYEEDNQRHNQGINGDRFREGDAEDHVRLNRWRVIGIASHRLHSATHREADADATAGGTNHGQAGANRFTQDNR